MPLALIAVPAVGYALMVRAKWLRIPYGLAAGIGTAILKLGTRGFAASWPAES